MNQGWNGERQRHLLASKGIKSKFILQKNKNKLILNNIHNEAKKFDNLEDFLDYIYDKEYYGQIIHNIKLDGSFSDPGTLYGIAEMGKIKDGLYEGGDNNIYKIVNNKVKILFGYKAKFDYDIGDYVIYKRPKLSTDIKEIPIYHRTDTSGLDYSKLDINRSGQNFPSYMQDLNGLYFSSDPTDKTFGKNVITSKISKDANVVTVKELIKQSDKYDKLHPNHTLSLDGWVKTKSNIDVITKQGVDGHYWEIIVMNPNILKKPDIDYTKIWNKAHNR